MNNFTVDGSTRLRRRRENGAARCWIAARHWVLGLSLVIACPSALAQAMYSIKPIGYLGGCTSLAPTAAGLNEAGQVAGEACNAQGDSHAFLWRNDGTPLVDLGPHEPGSTSFSIGLNASGLAVGTAFDSTGAFVFTSAGDGRAMKRIYDGLGGGFIEAGGINDLGQLTGSADTGPPTAQRAFLWTNDGSRMLDLGTLGGPASLGFAIDASGQVAGYAYVPGNVLRHHAFIWKNDGTPMLDLGTLGGDSSGAFYINASGQVAGTSTLPGTVLHIQKEHAFFWGNDGTPMQDLGTLGGAQVFPAALNDAGQVAGYSYTRANNTIHAFVWMNDGSPMHDLGTFGGSRSFANDINSSGQATGWADLSGDAAAHAFLWRNDGTRIRDLNKLIDPSDPLKPFVTLVGGELINDHRDIVAQGIDTRTGLEGLYLLESTGPASSVITVAPRALAFGDLPINTVSAAQSVTVTNTSSKAVAITGIALRGTAPGQFAFTEDCGSSLAGHVTCTLTATFRPSSKGAKTVFLNVNGGGGGLRSVKLTGTGT